MNLYALCWLNSPKYSLGCLGRWALWQAWENWSIRSCINLAACTRMRIAFPGTLSRIPMTETRTWYTPASQYEISFTLGKNRNGMHCCLTSSATQSPSWRMPLSITEFYEGVLCCHNFWPDLFIVMAKQLQHHVLAKLHDAPTVRHFGLPATYECLQCCFCCPGLAHFVHWYVATLELYQWHKTPSLLPTGNLWWIVISTEPF